MDQGFIAQLFFTSLSRLALWLWRGTAALLKWAIEKRLPSKLNLGGD